LSELDCAYTVASEPRIIRIKPVLEFSANTLGWLYYSTILSSHFALMVPLSMDCVWRYSWFESLSAGSGLQRCAAREPIGIEAGDHIHIRGETAGWRVSVICDTERNDGALGLLSAASQVRVIHL
jgi:hypothetical protein